MTGSNVMCKVVVNLHQLSKSSVGGKDWTTLLCLARNMTYQFELVKSLVGA